LNPFSVHRLTRRFLIDSHYSCRPQTSRCLVGMVCFGRILGKNGLSSHVWLHCELPGCRNTLLLACRSLGDVGYIYCDFPKDIDLAIIVSEESRYKYKLSIYKTTGSGLSKCSTMAGPRLPAYSIVVAYHVRMQTVGAIGLRVVIRVHESRAF
jgi:hypothetical protein